MTTLLTLPERHILDAMREAAHIRVDTVGKWHVVLEGERDAMWFQVRDAAEEFADELAANLIDQELV